MNVKEKLLSTQIIEDNEFLDKYVDLIQKNRSLDYINKKTQRHHIIPVCYYKEINYPVDNSKENLVNLYYKDHVLAHYYLALCSVGKFKYQNLEPIFIIMGHKNFPLSEQNILEKLPEIQRLYEEVRSMGYNPMKNVSVKEKHDSVMRSEQVRTSISETMKKKVSEGQLFNEQHRKNLSLAAKGNTAIKGFKKIYRGSEVKFVSKDKLDYFLQEGWTRTYSGKKVYRRHVDVNYLHRKLSDAHKGKEPGNKGVPCSKETREKLSKHFSNTNWMNNGIEQHQIPKDLQQSYLEKGYSYGRLKK